MLKGRWGRLLKIPYERNGRDSEGRRCVGNFSTPSQPPRIKRLEIASINPLDFNNPLLRKNGVTEISAFDDSDIYPQLRHSIRGTLLPGLSVSRPIVRVSEVDSPRFYTRQTALVSVIEGLEGVLSQSINHQYLGRNKVGCSTSNPRCGL